MWAEAGSQSEDGNGSGIGKRRWRRRAWDRERDRERDREAEVATQSAGSVVGSGSGSGDVEVATQGAGSGAESGSGGGDGSGIGIGKRRWRWVDDRIPSGGPHVARAASTVPVGARKQGDDVIDLDGEGKGGGEDASTYSQRPGKQPVGEGDSNLGKRKDMDGATMQQGKTMRQPTIKEAFGSGWAAKHRKLWLRFVYSNQLAFNIIRSPTWKAYTAHFRDKPPSVPMIWPSENEVASMDTVVEMAINVVAGLKDVQGSFDHTGATILSDGRKSHDGRPIVNFLAAGARGVMMWSTLNREEILSLGGWERA
ncbi:hypothetical protein CBR_g26079 [Chara braunii]|uniref:DUF659 domain-containing protein n=1 Tax=Chara braunii TaxID=69332 RepID=A0A388JVW0_CHABU|nr:hypothetical protein CBR_g26079 [Chara braunii]|eukprot:GBG61915.1 hypothetical protein CBR_g26079 [Chara braunii]